MGIPIATAEAILKLYFNATAIANVADNAASSPIADTYVSLHTDDPGPAGTQATNEVAYSGYARIAVARTSSGWTVTLNSASPAASITFATPTTGSSIANFWAVGDSATGAGICRFSGPIRPGLILGSSIPPVLSSATAFVLG